MPSGTIRCYDATEDSITVSYEVEHGSNASVFRESNRIVVIGSGTRSGSYTATGLTSGTSYDFYLRNGLFTYSDKLSKVTCKTESRPEPEIEEKLYVEKSVKSIERDSNWVNSISVNPGEKIRFSIRVGTGKGEISNIKVKDILPSRVSVIGNLKIDGGPVSGDIEEGINIGSIPASRSKIITFDAEVHGRSEFSVGSTTLINKATVSSKDIHAEDTASLKVIKGEVVGPPTKVPTGVTGIDFVDYLGIPLFLFSGIGLLFRRHLLTLLSRLAWIRREVRSD